MARTFFALPAGFLLAAVLQGALAWTLEGEARGWPVALAFLVTATLSALAGGWVAGRLAAEDAAPAVGGLLGVLLCVMALVSSAAWRESGWHDAPYWAGWLALPAALGGAWLARWRRPTSGR